MVRASYLLVEPMAPKLCFLDFEINPINQLSSSLYRE